ncbi:TIGR04149 family rSAM-modified RiPP [uncultured Parabacteroides sp.]|uniref:TIGR04149 family rSAM-modified RiPP n=1 Tax=uncultured Parabacteroides sp. TaxID=512312 RepID=UPI002624A34B|nr:TIGR04149 family rSAM-modified RiPP [uncultured Parabacteroides sp.]
MKRLKEIKVKKRNCVLSAEEMKLIIGGRKNVCWFECYCTDRSNSFAIETEPPCEGNAPWDRQYEKCPNTGLANCRLMGEYYSLR